MRFRKPAPDQPTVLGPADPSPEQRERYYRLLAKHLNKVVSPQRDIFWMWVLWLSILAICLIVWRVLV